VNPAGCCPAAHGRLRRDSYHLAALAGDHQIAVAAFDTERFDIDLYRIRRQAQVGGLINEYRLVEWLGRGFRHPQSQFMGSSRAADMLG
jgi:hypothetical protein